MLINVVYGFTIIILLICIVGLVKLYRKIDNHNLADMLEVIGFDRETYSIMKEGGYTKLYECQGIDIVNMTQEERNAYFKALHNFMRIQVRFSNIYVSVPYHVSTKVYEDCEPENENLRKIRDIKLKRMKKLNDTKLDDKCFLIIEAKEKEQICEAIKNVENYLSMAIPLRELTEMEMLEVLRISYNPFILERGVNDVSKE